MRINSLCSKLVLPGFLWLAPNAGLAAVLEGGFETPDVAAPGTYVYRSEPGDLLSASQWHFPDIYATKGEYAGIVRAKADGSIPDAAVGTVPEGHQVAFFWKLGANPVVYQDVVITKGGSYQLSLYLAAVAPSGILYFNAKWGDPNADPAGYDSLLAYTITSGMNFTPYSSQKFTVDPGTYRLWFGTDGRVSNVAYLDAVSLIDVAPEPASVGLIGVIVLAGVGLYHKRHNR